MALSTFSDLKAAVATWLNRSNLTTQIPYCVQLCETRIAYGSREPQFEVEPLRIRAMETSADITVNAQTVALPTGYFQARRFYIDGDPVQELSYIVPDVFWRNWISSTSDKPQQFTIEGENFVFGPTPDTTYTGKFLYYQKFTALSADSDTNWLLTNAFNVYLFGTLTEAYILARQMDQALAMNARFVGQMNALNLADKSDRYSGSPWAARPDTWAP